MLKQIIFIIGIVLSTQGYSSIWSAVTGHIDDVSSRFTADKFIVGNPSRHAIKSGAIDENAIGQDFLHNASGEVYIVTRDNKMYVQFAENFNSSLGPDYHVYISQSHDIKNEEDFHSSEQIELGKLVKGSGASYYQFDAIAPRDVGSVAILCKEFDEYIGSANLN